MATSGTRSNKTKPKHTSITRRWLINTLFPVALVLFVAAFALIYAIHNYYYDAAKQYLTARLSSIVSVLNRSAQDTDLNFDSEIRTTIETFSDKDKMELMAINMNGRVTLTSSGFSPEASTSMPDYDDAMSGLDGYWVGSLDDEPIMAVTILLSAPNTSYSAVRVITSLSEIRSTLRGYTIAIIAACTGILLLLVITEACFVRSIVRPIRTINATTKKFAKGDFSVRIRAEHTDEIGDLCTAINQMADELSNTETMKNEFISSVSHELRTPLTAIQGWSETLALQPDKKTTERAIQVIQKETARLAEMVEELLDFSRIQDGKFSLHCANMDILAELGDAVLMYTEKAKRDNINLIYHEPEMLPFLYGDKNRIRQVFINVIDNAIKYTNPGGTVTIIAESIGDKIQITVTDNGVGISETDLPRVKTKFFKANYSKRGSGIGLAVADEIITMHGGRIDIESELYTGTSVRITLPVENDLKDTNQEKSS